MMESSLGEGVTVNYRAAGGGRGTEDVDAIAHRSLDT